MAKKVTNIEVKDATVRTIKHEGEDFVCITDIARQKNSSDPNGVIANWMRNRNTIEFLGIWEQLFKEQKKLWILKKLENMPWGSVTW